MHQFKMSAQVNILIGVAILLFTSCLLIVGVGTMLTRGYERDVEKLGQVEAAVYSISSDMSYAIALAGQLATDESKGSSTFSELADKINIKINALSNLTDDRELLQNIARGHVAFIDLMRSAADKTHALAIRSSQDLIWNRLDQIRASTLSNMREANQHALLTSWAVGLIALITIMAIAFRVRRHLGAQEIELVESKNRFRDFAQSTADVFWEMNAQGVIIEIDTTPECQFLLPTEEIVGRTIQGIIKNLQLRDDTTVVRLDKIIQARKPFRNFLYALRAPEGGWCWRSMSGTPIFDDAGTYLGVRGTIVDQTARMRAEEAKAKILNQYRGLAAVAQQTVLCIDSRGTVVSIDSFEADTTEALSNKFVGLDIAHFFELSDDTQTAQAVLTHIAERASFRDLENRAHNVMTNSRDWYRISGTPLLDEQGKHEGYMLALANISAVKTAERENLSVKQHYDHLLGSIPGAALRSIGVPGQGKLSYISNSIKNLSGFSADEIHGREYTGLVLEEDLDATKDMVSQMVQSQSTYERKVRIKKKDGSYLWVLEKGIVTGKTPAGDFVFDALMLDINNTTRAENRARDAEQILSSVISNLTAGVYSFTVLRPGVYKVNYASPRIQNFLGYNPASMGDEWNLLKIVGEEQRNKIIALDTAGEAEPRSFEEVRSFVNAKGEVRWISSRGRFLRHDDGTLRKEGIVIDITEQRLRDERAMELAAALDQIEDGVAINDGSARVLFCNPAMARLVGVSSPTELIGKHPYELVTPTEPGAIESLQKDARAAATLRHPWKYSFPATTNAGEHKHLEGSVTILGESRMISIIRDVTARITVERQKQDISDAIARMARDDAVASGDMIAAFRVITEEAGRTLNVARAGVWLLENNDQQLTCADLYTSSDSRHSAGMQIPIDRHEIYFGALKSERVIVAHDARTHEATACFTAGYLEPLGITSALKVPIRLRGNVVGVVCCEHVGPARTWLADEITFATIVCDIVAHALDAAERKTAQDNLAGLSERLSGIVAALDNARDAIMILDDIGKIIYLNPSGANLIELATPNLAVGMLSRDLIRLDDSERSIAKDSGAYDKALQSAGFYSFNQKLFVTQANAHKHVAGTSTRLPSGGRIVVMHDTSERIAQERRENELKEQLVRAKRTEAIGSLAGGIAHDFNNLVAVMRSFAELIDHQAPTGGNVKNYAGRIMKTCDRAAELVKQIMTFSRASSADHEPVNVAALLAEIKPILSAKLLDHIQLEFPEQNCEVIVSGHAGQLIQVIMNVGLNAIEAMRGVPHGVMRVDLEKIGGQAAESQITQSKLAHQHRASFINGALVAETSYVRIRVSDSGYGITESILERIFEPFFSTKTKHRGTGLGLAIASSVVAAHHGVIAIMTESGVGTTFDIYLPSADGTALSGNLRLKSTQSLRGHERIMIIDDEVDLADGLSIGLNELGYETLPVYDPLEALELFAEDPSVWDAIVTDQVMPKMQGLSVIQELKKLRPDVKVMLYTGYSDVANEQSALAAGAMAFAEKPVSAETLARILRTMLNDQARAGVRRDGQLISVQ